MSKRDQILHAAVRIARAEGPNALSVRAVANEAGVGATTLRHYFPTQAVLHQAVAAELVPDVLDDGNIADSTQPERTRLYTCLLQFLPPEGKEFSTLLGWFELYRLSFGLEGGDGARGLVDQGRDSSKTVLRRWLTILADQGHVLTEEVDTQVLRVLALIDGIHLTLLVDQDSFELDGAKAMLLWYVNQVVEP